MTDYVSNILSCWAQATDDDRRDGMAWYAEAHSLALELSPGDVWRGAGVISALSPLKKWPQNVILARRAFSTGVVSGNIGQHNEKAQRILDGEHPLDVLNGDKTRNFTMAIATAGHSDIATIDRHAHDIAMAEVFTDATRKIGKKKYREMAAAYAIAAHSAGVTVNEMQAITWVVWRRVKGVK